MSKAAKGFRYIAGQKGRNRVRAFAKADGSLYLEFREQDGTKKRTALKHTDKRKAAEQADELAAMLLKVDAAQAVAAAAPLTLRSMFDSYGREITPSKAPATQAHDRACFVMFCRLFGANTDPAKLCRSDWDKFIKERRAGRIGLGKKKFRPAGNETIAKDLKTLRAVLRWGTEARNPAGEFYLQRDPLKGLPFPSELNPQRPTLTEAQYRALLTVAERMNPTFRLLLVTVHQTGHRIGAVRQLRWSDLDLEHGLVTWPASTDKMGRSHTTPLSQVAVEALREAQRRTGAIGQAWIFPAPTSPEEPCSRYAVDRWLENAVKYAGLKVPKRFGFHSFRRAFATDLKEVPLRDLMALGGWQDSATVIECYQQPEQNRMREALRARRVG
jgi:integrase